jgi:hypothetical protein
MSGRIRGVRPNQGICGREEPINWAAVVGALTEGFLLKGATPAYRRMEIGRKQPKVPGGVVSAACYLATTPGLYARGHLGDRGKWMTVPRLGSRDQDSDGPARDYSCLLIAGPEKQEPYQGAKSRGGDLELGQG